jgi:3-O-methylgallate 3,4-dioxygenase
MAKIVVGIGTSHSPMLSTPPEYWHVMADYDQVPGKELMSPRSGKLTTFGSLLTEADPAIATMIAPDIFQRQYEQIQHGITTLEQTLKDARPDAAIVVGADQEEVFFDDNMPAISIYWGDAWQLKPWTLPDGLPEAYKVSMWGYGKEPRSCPIDTELAKHLIDELIDADFDISTSRYTLPEYGGSVGPAGYFDIKRETKKRSLGMAHAYAFVVQRIMNDRYIPIVPVTINACYPPNQPTAKRCYELGRAIRNAVASFGPNKRVAVIGSGGLSHFVVDEELDRMALKAMGDRDAAAIAALPKHRLNSAAAEIKPWIVAAGALEDLKMDVVEYVACRRTPAGTGGGWGFAQWT